MQHSTRTFSTGATRDGADDKYDFDGFISPLVLEAFGAYMHHNRQMIDGTMRDSDNWQKGIPRDQYMKSAWRHFMDWWKEHRGYCTKEGIVWALLGLLFNLQGYLHELLKENPALLEAAIENAEARRAVMRRKLTKPAMTPRTAAFEAALLMADPGSNLPRAGAFHD